MAAAAAAAAAAAKATATTARATVHGAVSLVNAIATRRGATLGISLRATATVTATPGKTGTSLRSGNRGVSSRLVSSTLARVVPKRVLGRNRITVTLESDIPTGYGLKSSSAISSAVALACARAFRPGLTDEQILAAGVDASLESKVSITGAYDDACSCYYGGFNVTDNARRSRVRFEDAPPGLRAVIFIPRNRRRANPRRLAPLSAVFGAAWDLARESRYWDAMTINGLAAAPALGSDPGIVADLIERGALAASVSGNGPAIAAIARPRALDSVAGAFSRLEGRVIVSRINNTKADADAMQG